jgi:glycosyltransferase A (GT-A) superfamily protein (DUF2064 family)
LSGRAVLVFARRPERGSVKTRLADCLGSGLTLSLYEAFLRDTLLAARESDAKVLLAHTPGPYFAEQELADFTFEQRGASFGQRFDSALENAAEFVPEDTRIILIGADTPHLSPDFLKHAFDALHNASAVVGPGISGGFYLLGFSGRPIRVAKAFTHSSSTELHELVRLLLEAGVKSELLEFWFDVDLPEDLARLSSYLDLLEVVDAKWMPRNTQTILRDQTVMSLLMRHRSGERRAQDRMLASPGFVLSG